MSGREFNKRMEEIRELMAWVRREMHASLRVSEELLATMQRERWWWTATARHAEGLAEVNRMSEQRRILNGWYEELKFEQMECIHGLDI